VGHSGGLVTGTCGWHMGESVEEGVSNTKLGPKILTWDEN